MILLISIILFFYFNSGLFHLFILHETNTPTPDPTDIRELIIFRFVALFFRVLKFLLRIVLIRILLNNRTVTENVHISKLHISSDYISFLFSSRLFRNCLACDAQFKGKEPSR